MAFYQFQREQFVHGSLSDVWDFISSPVNLKKITPSYMGFNMIPGHEAEKMYEGMIIAYKVSPVMGIRTTWVTEITQVKEKQYFIDEQRVGPYKLWHHQHFIEAVDGGVMMKDIVSYQPPMGILGAIANSVMIKHKLSEIFDYRKQALETIFPSNR